MTLLLLLACSSDPRAPLDLAEALGSGEARAGVVTDEDALFGGVSAEGQPGDLKIYNSQVQFIVQSPREGSYYVPYGGGLLDADTIRGVDEPGRDLLDEASPMVGLGRILKAERVSVLLDGAEGGPAAILAEGVGAPFQLLTGALESESLIPHRDVSIQTLYVLEPDSPLLQVVTTATWNDVETTALIGDLYLLGLDVADPWLPGRGLDGEDPDAYESMSALSWKNEVVFSVFPDSGSFEASPLTEVLAEAAPALAPLQGALSLASGDEISWTTYVGVGRDPAALRAAWAERVGLATEVLGGTVLAGGEPVAGARVHLLDAAGLPVGLSYTDEEGAWSAALPPGQAVSAVATGRGHAIHVDLPEGAGWYGPYAAEGANALALASMADGALAAPFAEGYGVSETVQVGEPLSLTRPGWLHISSGDGLPAVARVAFAEGDPVGSRDALVPDRPSDLAALVFLRDGELLVPVEPGAYEVVVHRGARWELHQQTVEVASDETVAVDAVLVEAYAVDDLWTMDPHSHAAPSADGSLPMEDRLIVTAAHGIEVHFGTDHDHIADYRPLLAPLGLDGVLESVVADEVSPVLRGHFNAWPLQQVPEARNRGAVLWWEGVESTQALFEAIRGMADELVLQANHPAGMGGLFGHAEYDVETGTIGQTDRWSEDFDAMEVLNAGHHDDYLPFYLDLVNRGYTPLPVGVSDSHSHKESVGASFTWLHHAPGQDFSPEALLSAAREGGVVASTGPLLLATIDGEPAPGRDFTGQRTLDVVVFAPSWMALDTLSLLRDGVVVETMAVSGDEAERATASFSLAPEADASYVVIVSGSGSMAPAYPGRTPWAMTAAVRLDVDGDGWEAPLPPLVLGP